MCVRVRAFVCVCVCVLAWTLRLSSLELHLWAWESAWNCETALFIFFPFLFPCGQEQ